MEPVADPTDGFDATLTAGIDLLPQVGDVHTDYVVITVPVRSPQTRHEVTAIHDLAGGDGQALEHRLFNRGEVDRLTVDHYLACGPIHMDPTDCHLIAE